MPGSEDQQRVTESGDEQNGRSAAPLRRQRELLARPEDEDDDDDEVDDDDEDLDDDEEQEEDAAEDEDEDDEDDEDEDEDDLGADEDDEPASRRADVSQAAFAQRLEALTRPSRMLVLGPSGHFPRRKQAAG